MFSQVSDHVLKCLLHPRVTLEGANMVVFALLSTGLADSSAANRALDDARLHDGSHQIQYHCMFLLQRSD